ncbi:MAG TPA: efflux RND transporter periplasmic adaptor subunit [Polyangia bacterium]|nr:efflux RND transporter periplasmic adaptor subunit [Polyangia bacterium]
MSSSEVSSASVPESRARRGFVYVVGVALLGVVVIGVVGLGLRRSSSARAEASERQDELARGPRVRVAKAVAAPPVRKLSLQGEARPFAAVTLYAKVSGYLKVVRVDKGDRVKAGQLLATIEAPEIDKQLQAASADARNKRVNAKRFESLAPSKMVSAQEVEAAQANADVAEANEAALATQGGYRVIKAPFDGVVTARFADPGALIQTAAAGQSGALPLFSVANSDKLRIYVYLDQSAAPFVRAGDTADVRVAERPGFVRKAQVTRVAGELATRTRTMLTEIDVDNKDGAILPGSFVTVTLEIKTPPTIQVPAEALVLRGERPFVAVVSEDHKVHFKPVVVADDDGQTARLASGLAPGERVALNLGEVEEGAVVQVVEPTPPPAR